MEVRTLRVFNHGLVEISEDGILEDGTPIEDYGTYMTREDKPFPDDKDDLLDQFMEFISMLDAPEDFNEECF
jgi:hypothetical protein